MIGRDGNVQMIWRKVEVFIIESLIGITGYFREK